MIPLTDESPDETLHLTLAQHLNELKKRIVYSAIAILTGFAIAYFFSEDIYRFLLAPLADALEGENRRMIYTGLAEAFLTYIKLSFFAGMIIAFPVITYQIYSFIAPGLYKKERNFFLSFVFATPLLFVAGAAFVYYFLFPLAWKFFLSFESMGSGKDNLPVQLEARVSEYLSLVTGMIMAFGLSFQLPIVLILLMKIGFIDVETLKKGRKYAVVILLIIAAILTPPDVLSQVALFTPLYILYEASILIGKYLRKQNNA